MLGLECLELNGKPATQKVLAAVEALLKKGIIILPEGPDAHIFGITPTFTMTEEQINFCSTAIGAALA